MTSPAASAHDRAGRPVAHREHSRWSLSLGHVAGIDVRVHVSFAVLVALVLATAGDVEGGAPAALLWLVLVFVCVLLHELAHCAVARRRHVVVDEILLLPIGGLSRMERLPEVARDEFAIAVVGPLSSLGLAVLAGAVSVARGDTLLPPALAVGPVSTRLFWFNLLLGGFNLLPAFPLDGGRVFRALLETRMDLEQATRRAARLGRVVAVALVVLGVLVNLWLIVIGVFVYLGASAEEAATVLHHRLAGRTVASLMRAPPSTLAGRGPGPLPWPVVGADEPVTDEVLDGLRRAPHHRLVVVRDDHVVGLLTPADVQHLLDEAVTPTGAGPSMPLPPPPPPPTTSHQIWRHRHGR